MVIFNRYVTNYQRVITMIFMVRNFFNDHNHNEAMVING